MKIVFRTDSSNSIGSGHLMRCLNLANSFINKKNIYFICRNHTGNLNYIITNNGYNLIQLPVKPKYLLTKKDSLLGASVQKDAKETIMSIKKIKKKIDWLIVDHYQIDKAWETTLKDNVKNIMVIDDYNNVEHNCKILLNTNIQINKKIVPSNTITLLGLKYFLLDSIYLKYRKLRKNKNNTNRILVYFGSTDPLRLTEMAIKSFLRLSIKDFILEVISSNNISDELLYKIRNDKRIIVRKNISSLANSIYLADLIIGSCGSTSWERLALKKYSILYIQAENQNNIANYLSDNKLAKILKKNSINTLHNEIKNFFDNKNKKLKVFDSDFVDGLGIYRVNKFLTNNKKTECSKDNEIKFNSLYNSEKEQVLKKLSVCTDKNSWINHYIPKLLDYLMVISPKVNWYHDTDSLENEDATIYLSYESIVDKKTLLKSKHNLVIHESNLPEGRGWSPLTWQILERENNIPITLFEASTKADSGKIYLRDVIKLVGNELIDEIRHKQFLSTLELLKEFFNNYHSTIKKSVKQKGNKTFYKKRTPLDSKIDINKSIKEQFDLLRVVDNEKYPAWFNFKKKKYKLLIEPFKNKKK